MEHLLNDAPPDDADEVVIKRETVNAGESLVAAAQTLPHLTTQLANTVASPSSSAASLGLHMLSVSAASPSLAMAAPAPPPPRLPPISLLTAAAAALQPVQCHPLQTAVPPPQPHQQRPVMTPLQVAAHPPSSTASSSSIAPLPQSGGDRPQADDMLCRYRNKKCGYPRAIKRNGERHNLCERHRAKANQNQRKLESKRRTQKRMMQRVADRVVKAKKAAASTETEIKFTLYGGALA